MSGGGGGGETTTTNVTNTGLGDDQYQVNLNYPEERGS